MAIQSIFLGCLTQNKESKCIFLSYIFLFRYNESATKEVNNHE